MRSRGMFLGLALALCVAAGTTAADQVITMELEPPFIAGGEKRPSETYTIWVGDSRLREDRKDRSVIVDKSASKMYVITHPDKTYHALDLPIDFESMVPPELLPQWKTVLKARKTDVTVQPGGSETLGEYSVKKYDAVITDAMGATINMTMWNTVDLDLDLDSYKQLMLEITALQPGSDDWIRRLFALDGYPVRLVRTFDTPQGKLISTEQLISVQEKSAPDGMWKPAADYTAVEFNLLTAPPD